MTVSERIKIIVPPLLLALAIYHLSALLVITAFLAIVYPLPLLLGGRKHGRDYYVLSTAAFLGITALIRIILLISGGFTGLAFALYEIIYLCFVFGLLYWFEYAGKKYSWVERVLVSLIPAFLATSALSAYLMTNTVFTEPLKDILGVLTSTFYGVIPEGGLSEARGAEELVWNYFRRIFLSVFGSGLFMMSGLNLVISHRIRNKNVTVLKQVKMPEWSVWLLFIPLTIVLIAQLLEKSVSGSILVQWISPLMINLVIVTGLLFGLQGVRIFGAFMDRFEITPRVKRLIFLLLLLFVFIPAAGKFLIFILPLLGISELWINYSNILKKEINQ